jgi:hypothetical protein
MKKNHTLKEGGLFSFSKFQTCIQTNKDTKLQNKHFIFYHTKYFKKQKL